MGEKLGAIRPAEQETESLKRKVGHRSRLWKILSELHPAALQPAGKSAKCHNLLIACLTGRELQSAFWVGEGERPRRETVQEGGCWVGQVCTGEVSEAGAGEQIPRLHQGPTATLAWMQNGSWMCGGTESIIYWKVGRTDPRGWKISETTCCHPLAYVRLISIDRATSGFQISEIFSPWQLPAHDWILVTMLSNTPGYSWLKSENRH